MARIPEIKFTIPKGTLESMDRLKQAFYDAGRRIAVAEQMRIIKMMSENETRFLTTEGKELKYRLYHKYRDSGWMETSEVFLNITTAIRRAAECSKDAIAYGMTAILDLNNQCHVVEFPEGGGKPCYIHPHFVSNVKAALEQKVETPQVKTKDCPDCKDGFYYPLLGPKEPCKTCCGGSEITVKSSDEKISDINVMLVTAWNSVPWKTHPTISRDYGSSRSGLDSTLTVSETIPANTMIEIIIDKLVDKVEEVCNVGNFKSFYQTDPLDIEIKFHSNGDRSVQINMCVKLFK